MADYPDPADYPGPFSPPDPPDPLTVPDDTTDELTEHFHDLVSSAHGETAIAWATAAAILAKLHTAEAALEAARVEIRDLIEQLRVLHETTTRP